ncbi:MAG: ATP-binding protein, partial [Planctomycetota bacterium]
MTTSAAATGTLKIGDQWNAITIIAHSQTHPLKAICEFTENAIDAGAAQVRITRRRSAGKTYLEVADDGRGVAADAEGEPDFGRIATHLCDSMKRHLDAAQRRGVHGEFGIGLLSFWSLGEELRMTSGGGGGPLRELCLTRGRQEYEIRPARGRLAMGGTRVTI